MMFHLFLYKTIFLFLLLRRLNKAYKRYINKMLFKSYIIYFYCENDVDTLPLMQFFVFYAIMYFTNYLIFLNKRLNYFYSSSLCSVFFVFFFFKFPYTFIKMILANMCVGKETTIMCLLPMCWSTLDLLYDGACLQV